MRLQLAAVAVFDDLTRLSRRNGSPRRSPSKSVGGGSSYSHGCTVWVSYLEIYQERVRDLLAPGGGESRCVP